MRSIQDAIKRGLIWLDRHQTPTGELPAYAAVLGDGPPTWVPDQLNFITGLTAEALASVDDPVATSVVDRAVDFLRGEAEDGTLWRYWAHDSPEHGRTPPDADDTACCSLAVACRGDDTTANHAPLLASMDGRGRFHTWLLWKPGLARRRDLRPLRNQRAPETRRQIQDLWSNTEADSDDVDAVVNANVCRYLGVRAPASAVDWVVSVIEAGGGTMDKWHHSPFALWHAVADGAARGVPGFQVLGPMLRTLVAESMEADADRLRDLDLARAMRTAQAIGMPATVQACLAARLVASQHDDGSWNRDLVYHGGPQESFGWASEALVTAMAIAALAAHGTAARSGDI